MLIYEIKSILHSNKRTEFRKFGLTVGGVLVLLGLGLLVLQQNLALEMSIIGGILIFLGTLMPIALKPFYIIWMSLSILLGFFMTRLLLGLIFFLIFTPVGLVLRLVKKDLLDESIDPETSSYWKSKNAKPYAPEMSEKQS